MKKLLIPLAVLFAIILIMPFVTGNVAESVTRQLSAEVNAKQLEYGTRNIKEYERGYRSTNFQLEWTAPIQLQPLFPEGMSYDCNGSHGILSYQYECQALDVPNYSRFVEEYLDGVDPVSIGGEVSAF